MKQNHLSYTQTRFDNLNNLAKTSVKYTVNLMTDKPKGSPEYWGGNSEYITDQEYRYNLASPKELYL